MFEKFLQELGLSDKEASLYLALLAVDYASVSDLSHKTKIKRPTVYVVLQTLEKKGLVSETKSGRDVRYNAEPPERLETFIEQQKASLEDKKRVLKDYLPQIKSLQRESGERPVVRFFEGKEGVLSTNAELAKLYDEKNGGPVTYLIYPLDLVEKIFSPDEITPVRQKRVAKGIKAVSLYTSSKGPRPDDKMSERILLNPDKYPVSCDITIYDNYSRIAILGKRISGIVIQSKEVADTLRSLFKFTFDSGKK